MLPPPPPSRSFRRLARQERQRLGSPKPREAKNSWSSAVKVNCCPQSTQVRVLSTKGTRTPPSCSRSPPSSTCLAWLRLTNLHWPAYQRPRKCQYEQPFKGPESIKLFRNRSRKLFRNRSRDWSGFKFESLLCHIQDVSGNHQRRGGSRGRRIEYVDGVRALNNTKIVDQAS